VYVQNASLEIAWTETVTKHHSIAGEVIGAFLTVDDEGFDVNTAHDFRIADLMVEAGEATLPEVKVGTPA
jgi:CMP-N-acetylneuraminic acid synthetase